MNGKDICKLTDFAVSCGCAAKVGGKVLREILAQVPKAADSRVLVGLENFDDAAVYELNEEIALVETVDFFPPVVDDPYTFGEIAAANALSDIYAMGAEPLVALAIVCFPTRTLSTDILAAILRGGADKVREAGAAMVGGHTVEDERPMYGVVVTGKANPRKIVTNAGAKKGDLLILTKPLGTGIIITAMKAELAKGPEKDEVIASMLSLNKVASRLMLEVGVNAATDITGFGLLGHLSELASASRVAVKISISRVPRFTSAIEHARIGLIPEGAYRNRDFVGSRVTFGSEVDLAEEDLLFDPQTSGGLLISVPAAKAQALLNKLHQQGVEKASIIGEVIGEEEGFITVTK
jgi:selenide,water dikinase